MQRGREEGTCVSEKSSHEKKKRPLKIAIPQSYAVKAKSKTSLIHKSCFFSFPRPYDRPCQYRNCTINPTNLSLFLLLLKEEETFLQKQTNKRIQKQLLRVINLKAAKFKIQCALPPSPIPPLQLTCFKFFRIKELLIILILVLLVCLSHTGHQRRGWWLSILHEPLDLTHKHLTIKHDLVGEKPATKCSQNN